MKQPESPENPSLFTSNPSERGERGYEQRHFNGITKQWSDWYQSSEAAYWEEPVPFYEVRIAPPPPVSGDR